MQKPKSFILKGIKPFRKLRRLVLVALTTILKNYENDPTIASRAKQAGLKLGSWTVNKAEDLKMLQAQGVTLITTNQPQEFTAILNAN